MLKLRVLASSILLVSAFGATGSQGQKAPAAASAQASDRDYYGFLVGSWFKVEKGVKEERPTFVVRQGVHDAAFLEDWLLVVDGKDDRSQGFRVWDPEKARWAFAWTSAMGPFQIWDSVKVGNDWYIQRPFERDGKQWLSREAWIADGPDHLFWVLQRSTDGGKTWETRSRTRYVRG